MNKITEKYFQQKDFGPLAKKALRLVCKKTGFKPGKEIFRGKILDQHKVGSVIFKGKLHGQPAVLKLQGLEPETEEAKIIEIFRKQNKSRTIRLPKILVTAPWNKKLGFGYTIFEFVEGQKIYGSPLASLPEMKKFAEFYQELKTKAIKKPFFKDRTGGALVFCRRRVEIWQKLCRHKKYIETKDYLPFVFKYNFLSRELLAEHPMVFMHGHLSPDDIVETPGKKFVLLSNLFWSWRPAWYDLAFNVWTRLHQLRDPGLTPDQLKDYVYQWIKVYKRIPVVKKDKDFKSRLMLMLLERCLGAILVDIGSNEELGKRPEKLKHFLNIQQQLFHFLYTKIKYS